MKRDVGGCHGIWRGDGVLVVMEAVYGGGVGW